MTLIATPPLTESSAATATTFATCPLCEATCGLEITTQGREVISIRGNPEDVFSRGYLCPKAYSLKELHADPDRIRQPMVRDGENWRIVSWQEAFETIERGLLPIIEKYGRNAVATYLGNPNSHNLPGLVYGPELLRALGSQNNYSASTVDQMPKQVAVALLFGTGLSVPIPDIDRTNYMLILGANPLVSNGSLMTAPNMRGRLRDLRARGGKIVVIDPVRTRTAQEADAHHFIKPGSDAFLLFALVQTLFAENLIKPGRLVAHAQGIEKVEVLARDFTPETVAPLCGIAPAVIRQVARELAAAPHAVVYARIGTCTQEFGTLASWLVDVLNFLTGNLDAPGGAMFPKAAAGQRNTVGTPGQGKGVKFGRWRSRVRGLPEVLGELPVNCLAEEIETPGEGQVRALLTIAGNPALSTPNSQRLQKGLAGLDFMVSLDIYLNETTRRANVVLPARSPLEHSHYDMVFYQLAMRNVAHYSPPVFEPEQPDGLEEWEIILKLADIVGGKSQKNGATLAETVAALDDAVAAQWVEREVSSPGSSLARRDVTTLMQALEPLRGPERLLEFMLRSGPYGDGFGSKPDGLTLAKLQASPHGVDLGPLQPRIPEVLRTPSGKIELAHPLFVTDVERLRMALQRQSIGDSEMLLIGRRDLRSNNSWMHNLNVLVKGKDRCTLLMHPTDAARLGFKADEEIATVSSRVGTVSVPLEITADIMPGVVSLPHGWGHDQSHAHMEVAASHPGVNSNILADETAFDPLSGNAVLNGIPVSIKKESYPIWA